MSIAEKQNSRENFVLRRGVLAGLLSCCAIAYLPIRKALASSSGSTDTAVSDFLDVSRYLTGHAQLDTVTVQNLYSAMKSVESNFDEQIKKLAAFIAASKANPAQLQGLLDAQAADLANLPKSILTAWYVGVVGKGAAARCVSFESNLMYLAVADHLKPPSYSYGPYGSWSRKPATS